MSSAWTGPPALARFVHIGWDTCSALLKVLLNATLKVKSLLLMYLTLVGHLNTILVSHLTRYLVGHLKAVMWEDLQFIPKMKNIF